MKLYVILLIILTFTTCKETSEDKLNSILNSRELYIRSVVHGGLGGYSEFNYHLKNLEYEDLLIINEKTDYQTFIRMDDEKKELFKKFILKAFETHQPNKEFSGSCMRINCEYIFSNGLTSIRLAPNNECDSLFYAILQPEE